METERTQKLNSNSVSVAAELAQIEAFQPKTPLGRKLWEIRQKIVAAGEPLLGWEEVEKEVTQRRNERA